MEKLIAPLVHNNGTSKSELLKQYGDVFLALLAVSTAMRNAVPNDRDYYQISPEAGEAARAAFAGRYQVINQMYVDFLDLAVAIKKQGE